MRQRDATAAGTQQSVKALKIRQVTGLTELRSRLDRCDMCIARLATELRAAVDATHALAARHQQHHAQLVDKIQQLDIKVF